MLALCITEHLCNLHLYRCATQVLSNLNHFNISTLYFLFNKECHYTVRQTNTQSILVICWKPESKSIVKQNVQKRTSAFFLQKYNIGFPFMCSLEAEKDVLYAVTCWLLYHCGLEDEVCTMENAVYVYTYIYFKYSLANNRKYWFRNVYVLSVLKNFNCLVLTSQENHLINTFSVTACLNNKIFMVNVVRKCI